MRRFRLCVVLYVLVGTVGFIGALETTSWAASPRHTAASAPILVTPFTGLHADEPQAAVLRALGDRAALVRPSQLARLSPYVIVSGAVVRRDKQLIVEITVTSADTRQPIGQVTMPILSGRHLSPPQLAELARQVDELASDAMTPPPPPAAPEPPPVAAAPPPPPPEAPARQAQDTEKAPLPAPLETSTPTVIRVTPKPPRRRLLPAVPRPRWYPWIEASVGALVDSRALKFRPAAPLAYRPGLAAGVHADVTVYPLAFLHAVAHGVFAGLGGGVTAEVPFWPTTQFLGTSNEYATRELRVEGGARWRFVVRSRLPRLEVTLLAGAGLHTYSIAKATDPVTGARIDAGPPDAAYVYGQFGFALRLTVWRERLRPWLSAAYEYFPDSGPVENVDEYGTADTHGLMARAGLDVRVWRGLRLGVSGFYELVRLGFTHDLPTQKQARWALDQYFGGVGTVGYDF